MSPHLFCFQISFPILPTSSILYIQPWSCHIQTLPYIRLQKKVISLLSTGLSHTHTEQEKQRELCSPEQTQSCSKTEWVMPIICTHFSHSPMTVFNSTNIWFGFVFVCQARVSLCSPSWLWTHGHPLASASKGWNYRLVSPHPVTVSQFGLLTAGLCPMSP